MCKEKNEYSWVEPGSNKHRTEIDGTAREAIRSSEIKKKLINLGFGIADIENSLSGRPVHKADIRECCKPKEVVV